MNFYYQHLVSFLFVIGFSNQLLAQENCSEIQPWIANQAYSGGEMVVVESKLYQANWWTQNNNPIEHQHESSMWSLIGNCDAEHIPLPTYTDCSKVEEWTATQIYTGGEIVLDGEAMYQAKWWTKSDQPSTHEYESSMWLKMGECVAWRDVPLMGANTNVATNYEWKYDASSKNNGGVNPKKAYFDIIDELELEVVRYPGGVMTQYWDFETGTVLTNNQWDELGLFKEPTEDYFDSFYDRYYPSNWNSKKQTLTVYQFIDGLLEFNETKNKSLIPVFAINPMLDINSKPFEYAICNGLKNFKLEIGSEIYSNKIDFYKHFPTGTSYGKVVKKWIDLAESFNQIEGVTIEVGINTIYESTTTCQLAEEDLTLYKMDDNGNFIIKNKEERTTIYKCRKINWNRLLFEELGDEYLQKVDGFCHHTYFLPQTCQFFKTDITADDIQSKVFEYYQQKHRVNVTNNVYNNLVGKTANEYGIDLWLTEYNLEEKSCRKVTNSKKIGATWIHGLYLATTSIHHLYEENANTGMLLPHAAKESFYYGMFIEYKEKVDGVVNFPSVFYQSPQGVISKAFNSLFQEYNQYRRIGGLDKMLLGLELKNEEQNAYLLVNTGATETTYHLKKNENYHIYTLKQKIKTDKEINYTRQIAKESPLSVDKTTYGIMEASNNEVSSLEAKIPPFSFVVISQKTKLDFFVQKQENINYLDVNTIQTSEDGFINCNQQSRLAFDTSEENIEINVYPNPTNGIITIVGAEHVKTFSVYNMLGAKVFETLVEDKQVDLSHLEKGVYIIKLINLSDVYTSKIIIE